MIKVTWEEYNDLVEQLYKKIDFGNYNSLWGVPRGGSIVASNLAQTARFPITTDRTTNHSTIIIYWIFYTILW